MNRTQLVLEKIRPYIKKFFYVQPRKDALQKLEADMAKGSRIKAMVESGGFGDYTDAFVDKFLSDLMLLAQDIRSGRAKPELLLIQTAEILGRLENFEWLKDRILTYEKDKENYQENKQKAEELENIFIKQSTHAR